MRTLYHAFFIDSNKKPSALTFKSKKLMKLFKKSVTIDCLIIERNGRKKFVSIGR